MARISVTKRGSYWQYRFPIASQEGQRKSISKSGFTTKKEAEREGTKALSEYNSAGTVILTSDKDMSVGDFVGAYLEQYKKQVRIMTYRSCKNDLNNVLHFLSKFKISTITPQVVQSLIYDLINSGLSVVSVKRAIANFRAVLRRAVDLGISNFNLYIKMKYPKDAGEPKEKVYSEEEIRVIFKKLSNRPCELLPVAIAYYTGMRVGEIFALTWRDVNFLKNEITVNKSSRNAKFNDIYMDIIEAPKNKTSNRTVKVSQVLIDILAEARSRQLKERKTYAQDYAYTYLAKKLVEGKMLDIVGHRFEDTGEKIEFICIKENGEKDSANYSLKRIKNIMKPIKFGYHRLRHTHATMLVAAGANIKGVQYRLGHSNIKTTLNIYSHFTEDLNNETAELFDSVVHTKNQMHTECTQNDNKKVDNA